MNRRKFLGTTATAGLALIAKPYVARAAKHELLVAEPVHSTGYLPMYIAMAKDYFAEADINVKIVTIETGSGHTNAVLSGQAFAFIGGPEHCAFAKAKGAELRAVVHCVDRGNVYFCAANGLEPQGRDFTSFVKGKAIATGGFGGTPNSITRYLLKKWKLDAKNDVTLMETANSAIIAAVKGKAVCFPTAYCYWAGHYDRIDLSLQPMRFFRPPRDLAPILQEIEQRHFAAIVIGSTDHPLLRVVEHVFVTKQQKVRAAIAGMKPTGNILAPGAPVER
jgi:NitT/TauT family transport system substrate-binding protein